MKAFETIIKPRFYETDGLGHISNTVIPAWFEIGRSEFLASLAEGTPARNRSWLTASVTIDYLLETFHHSEVTVRITDAKVGNTSMTIYCEMLQDGKVTVRGSAVMVFMAEDGSGKERVPEGMREALAARFE